MSNRSLFARAAAAPHVVWAVMFIVFPLIFVLYYALTDANGAFTLENLAALTDHAGTFFLSISLALIATVICVLIGYPMAYFISRANPRHQKLLLMAALLPMWINLLVRTYSMMALLDDGGMLNSLLGTNFHIVGTKGAVIFGMVYDFLPYMILPIYTVMSKLDVRSRRGSWLQHHAGYDQGSISPDTLGHHFRCYHGFRPLHQHLLHLSKAGWRNLRADGRHHRETLLQSRHLQCRCRHLPCDDDPDPFIHGSYESFCRR